MYHDLMYHYSSLLSFIFKSLIERGEAEKVKNSFVEQGEVVKCRIRINAIAE